MQKLYKTSFFYLILGIICGVFYREFTKINGFNGVTTLRVVHPHLLTLGFIFFLILTIIASIYKLYEERDFGKWYTTYNVGLIFTAITMMWRGILQVKGLDFKGLNHIAGLAHAILGVGLIWFMIILGRQLKSNENNPCKN